MGYEVVKKVVKKSVADQKSTISISKDGFRFSPKAREDFGIDAFSHAQLLKDTENGSKLAIKLLKEAVEDSNTIHKGAVHASAWIGALKLSKGVYDLTAGADADTVEFTIPAAA